jgi:hypothetical protein
MQMRWVLILIVRHMHHRRVPLHNSPQPGDFCAALCKILSHNICCLIQKMFELAIKPEF